MLLYDDGHFLQTLEKPPAALEKAWALVQRDARHCGIESLGARCAGADHARTSAAGTSVRLAQLIGQRRCNGVPNA